MIHIEELKKSLIDKVNQIEDISLLEALQKLIYSTSIDFECDMLSESQKKMLEMSEQDIRAGRLISQRDMEKRNLNWLDTM